MAPDPGTVRRPFPVLTGLGGLLRGGHVEGGGRAVFLHLEDVIAAGALHGHASGGDLVIIEFVLDLAGRAADIHRSDL